MPNKSQFLFQNLTEFFSKEDMQLKLFEELFSIDPKVPEEFQLELTELQWSLIYKTKHRESSLEDFFYTNMDRKKYKNIIPLAMKMFNIFGRKYICEQIFIKNQKRSCLTKENLGNILKIPTINMSEEYRFVTEKRCHSYIFLWIFSNFSKSRIEIYIILYPNNFRYIRSFL